MTVAWRRVQAEAERLRRALAGLEGLATGARHLADDVEVRRAGPHPAHGWRP